MSSPPSSSWQDRRFMWPAGREVHEGSVRRMSGSSGSDKTAESPVLNNATPATDAGPPALPDYPLVEKKVLSNPDAWGGDRRFIGRIGREVHEPARRLSGSSASKPADVPKASSPPATSSGGGIAAAIAGRRRSSASNQGGIFSGLMANRDAHSERRQGWEDMKKPEGFSAFMSGLVNTKPAEEKK
ncbi:uncharacterized protein Z520_02234 [Fonsecaea multimorphosa CBS 102226]|uniref:Uncharacterized protein n=1 Tax=Fonsecaea multimorphosa CBS 102226 TaxID=1442371 RepID=A0A0D2HJM5_9EURO|nr:uncharacterized protein Z520_02234 [Fonsecaea multimorphosa CBS 102226]KIY02096.1 hypothetical protein Z520_02234 [Fonsecaea multimorphosa CBS 102226]OAL29295.1 hypothetical protein AYO22_02189 [Fonsecaea multimorphosa]